MTTPKRRASKEKARLEKYLECLPKHLKVCREVQFHPERRWQFDWTIRYDDWPPQMPGKRIAIEYEGGVFTGGGHTRGLIYGQNCEKYNTAALMGWTVLRFTAPMIRAGMHETMIAKALE